MRIKVVEMDGAKFTIAALSIKQVENLHLAKDGDEAINSMFGLVLTSLKNAGGDWTAETLRNEVDYVLLEFLFREIMNFSGLGQYGNPTTRPRTVN